MNRNYKNVIYNTKIEGTYYSTYLQLRQNFKNFNRFFQIFFFNIVLENI